MTSYAPQTTDPKAPEWARSQSHLCGAIATLKGQLNAHYPNRDHGSDGFLGDARHLAESERSDHNPWIRTEAGWAVRAGDFDVDGINAPWLAEQLRLLGKAGDPRLGRDGYVIFDGHIASAASGWEWVPYVGDPHTTHVHVSATRTAACELTDPWEFLNAAAPAAQPGGPGPIRPAPAPTPAPAPAPAAPAPAAADPVHWTSPHAAAQAGRTDPFQASGQDGSDRGSSAPKFRASMGDQGPGVAKLQAELNRVFPAYSRLQTDGVYWTKTAAVVAELGCRAAGDPHTPPADAAALKDSDGQDFGPRACRAAVRYGLNL